MATLIVEDGTGLENANSYISVAYADSYFSDRAITAWQDVSDKESAIIKATDYIDAVYGDSFKGYLYNDNQALAFPRVIDDENTYPPKLLKACAELALKASSSDLLQDVEQHTIEETVGSITVKYDKSSNQKTQYSYVFNLLKSYLLGGQYSAKVVRR